MENINIWIKFLEKTKVDLPDMMEIIKCPFMEVLIRKYEFLGYCIHQDVPEARLCSRLYLRLKSP